jgi:glycosyltransferase involved in cell wall biosynthesis
MIQKEDNRESWSYSSEFTPSVSNKNEYPKISIITPSYNQGQFIEETIRSVVCQDYPNIEYIIIDGGSKDNSVEIIHKYEKYLHYWISEPDSGQTHAINKGLSRATGDIIAYLNSDDIYLPETFKKVEAFFQENPDIDMVYGNVLFIDEKSNVLYKIEREPLVLKEFYGCNFFIPQPTVFLRRKIVEKCGFFDETLNLAMDLDYWMRISFNGNISYLPELLAGARIYPSAKSSAYSTDYLEEKLRILKKYEKYLIKQMDSTNIIDDCYSSVYFIGGLCYLKRGDLLKGLINVVHAAGYNSTIIFNPYLIYCFFSGILGEDRMKQIAMKLHFVNQ